jgi:hypothetical protein
VDRARVLSTPNKPSIVDPADGLPVLEIGPWTAEKHDYLRRYITAINAARARFERMDILLHFPTNDLVRNLRRRPDRISAFLGTDAWKTRVTGPRDVPKLRNVLREQLLPFGYQKAEIRHEPLLKNTKNAPPYHLVLIAKHGLADKIWQSVIRVEGSGQKRLW